MSSYTTPRTANVGDTWTAAWYNGELRDNIKWLHDLEISQGASFPSSPVTGQRHIFVSGSTRLPFAYDGSHWISDEIAIDLPMLAQYNAGAVGAGVAAVAPLVAGPGVNTALSYQQFQSFTPTVDTVDTVKNNAMTLQARVLGTFERSSGTTGGISLGVATSSAAGVAFGAHANVAGTEATVTDGFYSGSWADVASGSVAGVQFSVWTRYITGATFGGTWRSTGIRLRYKL